MAVVDFIPISTCRIGRRGDVDESEKVARGWKNAVLFLKTEKAALLFRFHMLTFLVSLCLLRRTSLTMTPDSSTMWTLTTASPWKVISSSGPVTHSRPGIGLFTDI